MKPKPVNLIFAGLLLLGASSCATISSSSVGNEAKPKSYARSGANKGVVILAVNWYRFWGCGAYENAEIMKIGFDRLPLKDSESDIPSEVLLKGPPRLMKKPVFLDYALLLEPGEYALTSFDIKAARSIQDVGHFVGKRFHLMENGKPLAGSFEVKAGEMVYIGNFYLDCFQQPKIWRYYTEGLYGFKTHMAEVKEKYPFIDPEKVKYRLFKTTKLGLDYELPQ